MERVQLHRRREAATLLSRTCYETSSATPEFGADTLGKALVKETKLMFRWWHMLRERGLSRSGFQAGRVGVRLWSDAPRRERMRPLMKRMEALLEDGTTSDHKKTAGKCRKILTLRAALWTFVRIDGVEPTNNAAERSVRPAVLWRKGSFGSASERGSRFPGASAPDVGPARSAGAERILTVAATCRQQGRNVLDYLVVACEAHTRGEPAPSLLPAGALSAAA